MKTALLPAPRVEQPASRQGMHSRLTQQEFVARGLASLSAAQSSEGYLSAEESTARLQRKLDQARKAHAEKSGKNRT